MTKIKVYKIPINKNNKKIDNITKNSLLIDYYDDQLTQYLKLKTIPRYALDITYEKASKIIQELSKKQCFSNNICCQKKLHFLCQKDKINCKLLYYDLCMIDIRLPLIPDERFNGQFDWIYYLSIERIYYELDKCKEMIDIYLKENPEIKKQYLNLALVCQELCKLDNNFPPNGLWIEYYKVHELSDIIKISFSCKKSGVIL